MAFVAALPLIFSAVGAATSGVAEANSKAYSAAIYDQEGHTASVQGASAEANQRRQSADTLGKMTAAAGQAGAGYGGSTGRAIQQSATNMELDALNIRYKASLQKWAYGTQSSNLSQESQTAGNAGMLRAGAALLKGYNNYANPGTDLG